jgi:hypothetical protein
VLTGDPGVSKERKKKKKKKKTNIEPPSTS